MFSHQTTLYVSSTDKKIHDVKTKEGPHSLKVCEIQGTLLLWSLDSTS